MRLIDTHTHLTAKEYTDTLDDLLTRAQQADVDRWITIGNNLPDSAAAVELTKKHPGLFCSVGIHPHDADTLHEGSLEELRILAASQKVLAIGEIGLDYYYEYSTRPMQRAAFEQQLQLAGELSLPLIIHCRDAMNDCLDILKQWQRTDVPVVFHCFSGDTDQAGKLLERGYFISFTGIITFKNAAQLQKAAQFAPIQQIMLETDCPYMSPAPKRSVKPNEPALLIYIAQKLAQLKAMPLEEIADITTDNSQLFFGLTE